jgi:hypothetical protein
MNALIIGGRGDTVIPAVQQYVQLRGLPLVAKAQFGISNYVALAAQGWLKSKCREGNQYRHAYWPGFGLMPAADAALYQTWLAQQADNAGLAIDLRQAAAKALEIIKPNQYYNSGVGHVRTPAVSLTFGQVRPNIETGRATARHALQRLGTDGVIRYSPGATDYGKTYWTNHANGLTGRVVADLLEAAAFCGDRDLIAQAIARLGALDIYKGAVPRGAQTWEIPLHTPDILASAHLIDAYVTGYELAGDPKFLEQAIYWAWTGVPFVYLVNPTDKPVGPYSTIAVLGATSWRAPVWFGQPVQWCGLVYADALYRLAEIDRAGPWKKIADGITFAGIQHTWKSEDAERVGLLPDFFLLQAQRSDGPAINPGTVGICAARLYNQPPLYDFRGLRFAGLLVHAPGEIIPGRENERLARFLVRGWPKEPFYVLIAGFKQAPQVKINGQTTPLQAPHEFDAAGGWLALQVTGNPDLEITLRR